MIRWEESLSFWSYFAHVGLKCILSRWPCGMAQKALINIAVLCYQQFKWRNYDHRSRGTLRTSCDVIPLLPSLGFVDQSVFDRHFPNHPRQHFGLCGLECSSGSTSTQLMSLAQAHRSLLDQMLLQFLLGNLTPVYRICHLHFRPPPSHLYHCLHKFPLIIKACIPDLFNNITIDMDIW